MTRPPMALSPMALSPRPLPTADHVRSVVSSLWHGAWQLAITSPWVAIVLMVPAVALLVGCTRLTVRRG